MVQGKVEICGVNTAKLPLLKQQEKEALFVRIKEGDAEAREEFIKGNLRLVLSVIKRFSSSNENVDDLFQIGCIGLMKAIDNFDITLQVKFSTYAVPMNVTCRKERRNVKMTRKQALLQAIGILGKDQSNQEICEKLNDIIQDYPIIQWNQKNILDSIDQFILDNGRMPVTKDFNSEKLPAFCTVKNKFKLNYNEFKNKYYKEYITPYSDKTKEEIIDIFKNEYIRLNYPTMNEYDKKRNKEIPSHKIIVKLCGFLTWNELLYNCGFEILGENNNSQYKTTVKRNSFKIKVVSKQTDEVERINKLLGEFL